ncbi:hypothetical protein L198_08135 [Cryptococcus wingfieldii CBS 7118]|uniref:F-box domain-containing protein n=1 Tax=Cryptococcus wingfieldii CBS 7118 TaxID=1295528 RepID=A0A1E3HH53_9TREE|nr:hypothetical protein L198_08135 [Cryptococcus wingfieldii CBS 7118]ODN75678.1 hypothetical protein L198_08135 [Cryptococcus wingfieldii CBS 7118]
MSPLQPLFSQSAYAEVLIGIFDCLTLREVVSLIRVNKYIHHVFTNSSSLQLAHTQRLLSVPPSASDQTAAPADRLSALKERQRRMDELDPSCIKSIRKELNADVVGFGNGMLLFHVEGENSKKRKRTLEQIQEEHRRRVKIWVADEDDDEGDHLDSPEPHERCQADKSSDSGYDLEDDPHNQFAGDSCAGESSDGWDVYRAPGAASDRDSVDRGGVKDQGLWHWKTRTTTEIQNLQLCGEDNLVALLQKGAYNSCLSVRITFCSALPPLGTPAPEKGFLDPIPHPDAALPFIELLFPVHLGALETDVLFGPGGQMSILINERDSFKTIFGGVWDWKKGVSLGSIPIAENQNISIVSPCGPFAFTASARRIPPSTSPDTYAKAMAALQLPPAAIPDELEGFLQYSFDAHILFPSSLGFPATPDPPDANPHAQAYPNKSCSWYTPDIPPAFLVAQFNLPLEKLIPYTLAAAYQPGAFSIHDLDYSPAVHNSESLGIFTWGLWGKTHVADLSALLGVATDLSFRLAMAEMVHRRGDEMVRLRELLPNSARDQPTDIAGKASMALVLMRYERRVAEDGRWREVHAEDSEAGDGGSESGAEDDSGDKASDDSDSDKASDDSDSDKDDSNTNFIDSVLGKDFMASFKSACSRRLPQPTPNATTSTSHPTPDPHSTDSPSSPASPPTKPLPNYLQGDVTSFLSLATVPVLPYNEWSQSSHMRMGSESTLASAYGSREARLVPVHLWDEEDEEEDEQDRNSTFVLSLSDYNESTLAEGVRAKRRVAGRRKREVESFKALVRDVPDVDDVIAVASRKTKVDKKLSDIRKKLGKIDARVNIEREEMERMLHEIREKGEEGEDVEDPRARAAMESVEAQAQRLMGVAEEREEVAWLFEELKGLAVVYGVAEEGEGEKVEEAPASPGFDDAPASPSNARHQPNQPPPPYLTLTLNHPRKPTSSDSYGVPSTTRTLIPTTSPNMPEVLKDYYEDIKDQDQCEGTFFMKRSKEMVVEMEMEMVRPPLVMLDGRSLVLGGFTPYEYHVINF